MTLHTDSYDVQGRCVLMHERPGKMTKQIEYWFRSLACAKRVYNTTQRVRLVIVSAMLKLRSYLKGTRSTIQTDHDSLQGTLNLSTTFGRLARRSLRLSELDFDVAHRANVKEEVADAPPRRRTSGDETSHLNDPSVCIVENAQNSPDEKSDVYVWTELLRREETENW